MESLNAKDELNVLKGASLADAGAPVNTDNARAARKVAEVLSTDTHQRDVSGRPARRWLVPLAAAACLAAACWILLPRDGAGGVPGTFNQVDSYHAAIDTVSDTAAVDAACFEIIAIDE